MTEYSYYISKTASSWKPGRPLLCSIEDLIALVINYVTISVNHCNRIDHKLKLNLCSKKALCLVRQPSKIQIQDLELVAFFPTAQLRPNLWGYWGSDFKKLGLGEPL